MIWAIAATTLAGSATVVGGLLALHRGMRQRGPLAIGLAFAAGLMIVLSVVEILPLSLATLRDSGVAHPLWWTGGALVVGCALVLLIDLLLPERVVRRVNAEPLTMPLTLPVDQLGDLVTADPRSDLAPTDPRASDQDDGTPRLVRSGLLIALVIAAHNAPEGLMTFLAMLEAPELGVGLAVAIAIHNIPEGMAIAAPIYAATGDRRRALGWVTVAGVAEPVGAILGYFVLRAVLPESLLVLTLALVAGMMIALSLRELIPASLRYQTHRAQSLLGFVAGGAVVWLSLALASALA